MPTRAQTYILSFAFAQAIPNHSFSAPNLLVAAFTMHIKPFKTMSQPQPSGTIPPRGAVLFLVMSWTLWLVLIGALATYFSPPLEPKVMYALMSVLFIPFIPFIPGLFVPFIVGTFTKLKALLGKCVFGPLIDTNYLV